jgi:predicted membrane channel-forming protein YqfA (hemolysin III family)
MVSRKCCSSQVSDQAVSRLELIQGLETHPPGTPAPIYPSIAAYVCGLVFYAFHYPESKWPGKFDYIGASHQVSS